MGAPRNVSSILLAIAVVPGGCAPENEFVAPPPPTVTVQTPARRDVTVFRDFTGRIDAPETVQVRARVKGFLNTMDFTPGRVVEQGQLLFTIEPESFQAAVDSAAADLEIKQAARDLAEVTLKKAEEAFKREAVTELEVTQRRAELRGTTAAVNAAKAAVETVKLDLGYTKIHAPVGGRISRDLVSVGNLVGANESTLLTTIVVEDPMHAYFNVDERFLLEILRMTPRADRTTGPPLEVQLQFLDGVDYEFPGTVDFGDNRLDPNTGTLLVRAVFTNPEAVLTPGMFVRVRIPMNRDAALLVPKIALQRDQVGTYVLVVDAQNVVQRRDVTTGVSEGTEQVITEGIEVTDRVIVNGLQRARPGVTVNPEAPETAAASAARATPATPTPDDTETIEP